LSNSVGLVEVEFSDNVNSLDFIAIEAN
jgi:hypothetical protein